MRVSFWVNAIVTLGRGLRFSYMARQSLRMLPGMQKQPNLDVLRSIAVIMVVASHAFGDVPHLHLQAMGLFGVAMFFVHTALVLMYSLQQRGPAFVPFIVRRIFRIYPLAICAVLVAALVYGKFQWTSFVSDLLLIQNLTGSPSYPSPLWSLPFELQMYLLLPATFLVAVRAQGAKLILFGWLLAVAMVVALAAENVPYDLVKYVPCFLPGVIAFSLSRRVPAGERRLPPSSVFTALIGLAILFSAGVAKGLPETPVLWFASLCLGLVLPFMSDIKSARVAAAASWIAQYSFGLYLFHQIALDVFGSLPEMERLLVAMPCAVAASVVGYHLVERPGINFGSRLANRWARAPAVMAQVDAKP
jgi:peptidoglycan/LPS O-acetylase OafA/YrhL